jgi:hypothetical protein
VGKPESPIESKQAKEEDGSPGPSGSGSGPKNVVKKEDLLKGIVMLAQRIRAFQVSQGIAGVRFLGVSPDELACRMSWMP